MNDPPTNTVFRTSAWTTREKLVRAVWNLLGAMLWRAIPPARSAVLRLFGGKAGPRCRWAASVRIEIPWNVRIGADVRIGPEVTLYSLGEITIGDGAVLDYRAHLCAGTHDFSDPVFPLLRPPIEIGAGSFIGMDAYIGPDVKLGERAVVHPRASVYRSFGDGAELRGNPAQDVRASPSEPRS